MSGTPTVEPQDSPDSSTCGERAAGREQDTAYAKGSATGMLAWQVQLVSQRTGGWKERHAGDPICWRGGLVPLHAYRYGSTVEVLVRDGGRTR